MDSSTQLAYSDGHFPLSIFKPRPVCAVDDCTQRQTAH